MVGFLLNYSSSFAQVANALSAPPPEAVVKDTIFMTLAQYKTQTFGALNLSSITTGRLMELSFHLFDSPRWDGLGSNEDTTETFDDWMVLYSTLYNAATNPANNTWLHPDTVVNIAKRNTKDNQIALMFLDRNYHRIRSTALSEGLFTLSSDQTRLLDVANRTTSPYDQYGIFTLGMFKTDITQFNEVKFVIPSQLWMSSQSSLQLDFGDGTGWRTVTPGQVVSINYRITGTKILKARATTTQGTKTAQAKSRYSLPGIFGQKSFTWDISANRNYLGVVGSLKADVYLGCGNVLDKPIIVLEGFDIENDVDGSQLFRDIRSGSDFLNRMYQQGYDFIFVDFNTNWQYIEANAYAVEALLNFVNSQKTGNFRSTLMGFSMGGLVARWCLRDMEERSLNHQVQNYFSIDSPQQGANIPVGMQSLFALLNYDVPFIRWFSSDFRNAYQAFQAPAARQMLVHKAMMDGDVLSGRFTDNLRITFAQALFNKGLPRNTNNYAIAFGSGRAVGQGYNPGDRIYSGSILVALINVVMDANAVPANNTSATIARYFFTGITLKKIFGLQILPSVKIRSTSVNFTGINPYDNAPGAYRNTQQEFASKTMFGATFGKPYHNFVPTASALNLTNQGFGTTNFQSNNMFYNVDNNPSPTNFTGVLTITANTSNTANGEHDLPVFNTAMGNFVMQRIHGSIPPVNCTQFCSGLGQATMIGSNQICVGSSNGQIYELQNIPLTLGLNINWEVTGSAYVESGQGTHKARIVATGDGYVNIKATVSLVGATCATQVFQRNNIVAGIPIPQGTYSFSGQQYTIQSNNNLGVPSSSSPPPIYINLQYPAATSYIWTVNSKTNASFYQSGASAQVELFSNGSINLTCTAVTPCGNISVNFNFYSYSYGGYSAMASPNPTDQELNITAVPEDSPDAAASATNQSNDFDMSKINDPVKLYDHFNQLKWQGRLKKGKVTIPVSNLPNGLYILKIEAPKPITKQIVVSH